jgi:hypothetical protein
MTIATILSQGNAIQLGPVTVEKTYPRKPGDKNRFLLVSDASGKGALKIWGAAANTELSEGMRITLVGFGPKGGLKTSEYNGKVSIDANDVRLEIEGQAAGAHTDHPQAHVEAVGYDQPRIMTQTYGAPPVDKLPMVMKRAATATALYVDELVVNHGYTKDEALMLAQNAPSWFPLWWFGEKGC